MRNYEVCQKFIRKESASGSNLESTGSKLLSYITCIAQWAKIDYEDVLIVNKTKYSVTTSKHQSYLNRCIPRYIRVIEIDNVPRDTISLINYYHE